MFSFIASLFFFEFSFLLQGPTAPPAAEQAGVPTKVGRDRFLLPSGLSFHMPFSLGSMHMCAWIEGGGERQREENLGSNVLLVVVVF